MKKLPDLSVVILCYRSEEHLIEYVGQVTKLLSKEKIDFELVLVANFDEHGPPDRTPQIVKQFAAGDNRCVYAANLKKGMMGWDLRSGLDLARGQLIAFLDGDGQTPPADIVRLYRLHSGGKYDISKIYRTERADSLFRKITSLVFNLLFTLFFPGPRIRDINGKPKLVSREAYKKMRLTSNDWFADAEVILEARRLKLTICEIPGVSLPNRWRKSFLGPGAILEFIRNLIVYRFRYWFFPDA